MRAHVLVSSCLVIAAACQSAEQPPAPAPSSPPGPAVAVAVAPAAAAPAPTIDDASFHLAFESQPTYTSGQPATIPLIIEPRGGYHVNQDYPIRVDLKAPSGVRLTKGSLGKSDATQIGEARARFEVGFSADPGVYELAATVDFAVCTKETCVPDQRTLAVALKVQ